MNRYTLFLLVMQLFCNCSTSHLPEDEKDWILGIEELYRLDKLPAFIICETV